MNYNTKGFIAVSVITGTLALTFALLFHAVPKENTQTVLAVLMLLARELGTIVEANYRATKQPPIDAGGGKASDQQESAS